MSIALQTKYKMTKDRLQIKLNQFVLTGQLC